MYAFGRLAYYMLSGSKHRPLDDRVASVDLNGSNLELLFEHVEALDAQFPGARHLLASCVVDRQPVVDGLQHQYLLLLAKKNDAAELDLLTGN